MSSKPQHFTTMWRGCFPVTLVPLPCRFTPACSSIKEDRHEVRFAKAIGSFFPSIEFFKLDRGQAWFGGFSTRAAVQFLTEGAAANRRSEYNRIKERRSFSTRFKEECSLLFSWSVVKTLSKRRSSQLFISAVVNVLGAQSPCGN